MISAKEALTIVRQQAISLSTEFIPLDEATGRILREPLRADRDFPPYDRVTMDGIALAHDDFATGQRTFPVAAIGAAGAPQLTLSARGSCIEIMTGAVLPAGTDTVVRYEDIQLKNGKATLMTDRVRARQNVHRQGEDRRQGDIIVSEGRTIAAGEIGVAATVGKQQLEVSRNLSALILSSGDELVPVSTTPLPHQIRQSNVYSIQAILRSWGVDTVIKHVADDQARIEQVLYDELPQYDVLLLSGGVSKGKFDYIPEALDQLGVQQLFHRVAQRPGKPFWFGHIPGSTVVFALPGNPVSSLACTCVYFGEWLRASTGMVADRPTARLSQQVTFKPELTYFLQVRLRIDPHGVQWAEPVEGHGSGDLANLVDADAFLMLPPGQSEFAPGTAHPVWRFRL